jgi:hypothetical protein
MIGFKQNFFLCYTPFMFSEKDKALFDAAMEGAYTGYLDYPVFLSEDEVTQRAIRYAQQNCVKADAELSEAYQNGWVAGYLLVCEFAQEDEELIKEQVNVITSSSRSKALQLVASLLKQALAKQVM